MAGFKQSEDERGRSVSFILKRVIQLYWRWTRSVTLGAQGAVIDPEGRFLLVRHGYKPGWSFPGGGVETGENALLAMRRELEEEAGVVVEGEPTLHGIFTNFDAFRGDHIVVYVVRSWRQPRVPVPNREITAQGFFAASALPEDTTAGTRRRIREIAEGLPAPPEW